MAIRRYIANQDNTITNAFEANLTTRGTGSNMGLADSLEVFSIYAQESSASNEQSRVLVQFPVLTTDTKTPTSLYTIQGDRNTSKIPASGSVKFYLRGFNVAHDQTLPRDFTLVVSPVSQSWEEGYGLDMESYSNLTYGGTGSNWINASANTVWTNVNGTTLEGGSFLSASWNGSPETTYDEFNYKQTFAVGTEELEIDITGLVEKWLATDYSNYGIGIMLTASQESGSRSYYTKKFSARDSEYFFKRPMIEARWDDSKKDHRGNFYVSSSKLSSADNLNTVYIYNYYRGQLANFAHPNGDISGAIYVNLFTSASGGEEVTGSPDWPVSGGHVSTGIYSASFALDTTASVMYDRWWSGSAGSDGTIDQGTNNIIYHTGSFEPSAFSSSNSYFIPRYVTAITNLQSEYSNDDIARLRLFTRSKDWSPTIYTVASKEIENNFIEDAYYKIYREVDGLDVVSYGTGSDKHTRLSYDISGSYFDLNTISLEPNYSYGIKFLYYINGAYEEQPEIFKFRVKE